VVDHRSFDLPKSLRKEIATKLERAGLSASKIGKLREFMPVGRAERAGLYGEALPAGLVLGDG
jgi:hypothetical protein